MSLLKNQKTYKLLTVNIKMEKGFLDIVLNKEKLSDGEDIFVANCVSLGIASQGKTMDEAMKNIKEAIEVYLEEQPEKYENLLKEVPSFSVIELEKNAKTSSVIGQRND